MYTTKEWVHCLISPAHAKNTDLLIDEATENKLVILGDVVLSLMMAALIVVYIYGAAVHHNALQRSLDYQRANVLNSIKVGTI